MAVLANDPETFVEETSLTHALHDCAQFAHVQPDALTTGADVNLHGTAGFRGQFLAALRAMHPVRFLQPVFLGFRLGLLLCCQFGHSLPHFLHPDVLVFTFVWFHRSHLFRPDRVSYSSPRRLML
jgi:hypothetical protein